MKTHSSGEAIGCRDKALRLGVPEDVIVVVPRAVHAGRPAGGHAFHVEAAPTMQDR